MTIARAVPDIILAIVLIATLECGIGLSLITGALLRLTVYLLALSSRRRGVDRYPSPLVLLPGRMFAGSFHAPTLEGQYVLKDIVLFTATMVIATTFRGTRIAFSDPLKPEGHALGIGGP